MSSFHSSILLKREKEKEILRNLRERLGDYVTKNQRLEDELFALESKYNIVNKNLIETKKEHQEMTNAKEKEIADLKLIVENQAVSNSQNSLEIKHLSEKTLDYETNEQALHQLQMEHKKVTKANKLLTKENLTLQEQNESYRRNLIQLKESKKSNTAKIISLDKEVNRLRKKLEEEDSIKEKTINELIQRKEEEIKSAYEGWSNETDVSLKKIECSLKEKHQEEIQNEEKKLKQLKKRYMSKCNDYEMLKDRFLALNKEMETKVKELASRYRFNVSQWEKKANSLENNNENLSDILKDEQTRFHEFMNSKISYDAELLHIKDILDGEDSRANKRKRRYSDLSPGIDSVHQKEGNIAKTKALPTFSPNIVKTKVTNSINILQKSAVEAIKTSVPLLFGRPSDHKSNDTTTEATGIQKQVSEEECRNFTESNKRCKTNKGDLVKSVAYESQQSEESNKNEECAENSIKDDIKETIGYDKVHEENLDISINDSNTITNCEDNNSATTTSLFSPNSTETVKLMHSSSRSLNLAKKAYQGLKKKDVDIDIIGESENHTEDIAKVASNKNQNRRGSVESTISQITFVSEFDGRSRSRASPRKTRNKSTLGHQCSWEAC